MRKVVVMYEGKEYIILHQHASGFCEIVEEGAENKEVKLVHFSELTLKS